jgi:hypothetical protein
MVPNLFSLRSGLDLTMINIYQKFEKWNFSNYCFWHGILPAFNWPAKIQAFFNNLPTLFGLQDALQGHKDFLVQLYS